MTKENDITSRSSLLLLVVLTITDQGKHYNGDRLLEQGAAYHRISRHIEVRYPDECSKAEDGVNFALVLQVMLLIPSSTLVSSNQLLVLFTTTARLERSSNNHVQISKEY